MVSVTSLWLPILLSAVAVFVVSSVIHMVLKYHSTDMSQLPGEDQILAGLAPHRIPAGEYRFPFAASMAAMKDPAFLEKVNRGPVGHVTIFPNAMTGFGKALVQWFIYSIVVSIFVAYVASRALSVGAPTSEVWRFTMTTAFLGYGMALGQGPIWSGKAWSTTSKALFDAVLYAAATAAVFVWLWPR